MWSGPKNFVTSYIVGYKMSIRQTRSPVQHELSVQSATAKTTTTNSLTYAIFILVVFALMSYVWMASRTSTATNSTKRVTEPYKHSTSSEGLTLWSSDFHISPIADVKHLLKDFGVSVIDKSLSGHCHLMNTCETDLRVINKHNGIDLIPCTNALRREFYHSYRNDPVMQNVDAFICNHAASMCELFMPFKKPMIVIASTRYEIGRLDPVAWRRWNENLRMIAASPFNTIAANNRYDQEYIRYFTGIKNVILLPNFCNYVNARYAPTRHEILLGPARGVNPTIQNEMFARFREYTTQHAPTTTGASKKILISPIRDLYPHFEYKDLAAHPAIVILPYQVSFMSLFEFYRMQIPLFVPSAVLLAKWHMEHNMLNERTWMGVFGRPVGKSALPRHSACNITSVRIASSTTTTTTTTTSIDTDNTLQNVPLSDPNNEHSYDAVLEWIQLSDFYTWPHIQTFNTWEELFDMLSDGSKLSAISAKMGAFNVREEVQIKAKWTHILDKIRAHKESVSSSSSVSGSGSGSGSSTLPVDINDSLQPLYGYRLSNSDCNAQMYGGDGNLRGSNA